MSYTEARAAIEDFLDAQPLSRDEIFAGETAQSLYAGLTQTAGLTDLRFTENDLARYMEEELEPKIYRTVIRIPQSVATSMRAVAREHRRSLNSEIEVALVDYLQRAQST